MIDPLHTPVVFRKVAVLGAGTMGAQIAAHFANAGVLVELLDMPSPEGPKNAWVEKSFKRTTGLKPNPFVSSKAVSRIRLGNFEEHFDRLKDVDWVVEAVVERLDIKQSLFEKVDAVVRPGTVVSSNTSGIPIRDIVLGRSESFQKAFLGTHFFNPPRYLKLCEVIPGEKTDSALVERIAYFVRVHLGKGVVLAKDSPYFIGNRIGIYAMMLAMKERSDFGFTMGEVDVLTGTLVGHPKSATFRTADVVGLDVMKAVISNLREAVPNDESRSVFDVPQELDELVASGRLGAKSGDGYYKKVGKDILSNDPKSMTYALGPDSDLPGLDELGKLPLPARLQALFADLGRVGASFRRTILGTMAYAARRIPEVSDSPAEVDNAIKWGFGWEMGPFEMWDVLGQDAVTAAMNQLGIDLPEWVRKMPKTPFYKNGVVFIPSQNKSVAIHVSADESILEHTKEIVFETNHSVLKRITDDVLLFEFRSKANTLGSGLVADLVKAVRFAESDAPSKGLVIANTGTNFSVGANLAEVGMALMAGKVAMIDGAVRQFQQAMEIVRNCAKPVVVAAHSRVLGGATEMMMSCRTPIAVSESYMGLVELGVGLIPAGTGCLRLIQQSVAKAASSHPSDIQNVLGGYFQQVAMAKVSSSAAEAAEMGYLAQDAPILMREERRFWVAVQEVRRWSQLGYLPPQDLAEVYVLGAPARAAFESMAFQMHQGRFISDYDLDLANKLAFVLTGGDLPGPAAVPTSYILDLERHTFMELLGQKKTQERIRHLLESGSPLRN